MDFTQIRHDAENDVLYASMPQVQVWSSQPLPDDDFVILGMDDAMRVVALQLIEVGGMSAERWRADFHTAEIPEPLFLAVSRWLADHASAGRSANRTAREF